jgi:hypothetical protein
MPTDRSRLTERSGVTRRRLLRATATAGVLATLAGCGGVTQQTFAAVPAGLTPEGMKQFDYATAEHEELAETRTRSVAGEEVEVTAESHLVAYGVADERAADGGTEEKPALSARWDVTDRQGRSLGILATPAIDVAGQELNPLASIGFEQFLSGPEGRQLLRRTGVVSADADADAEWVRGPTRLGTTDAVLLGSEASVESFFGAVADAETEPGPPTGVLVHLVRVTHEGDVVIVGGVQRRRMRALSGELDTDSGDDGGVFAEVSDEVKRTSLGDRRQYVVDALPHVHREVVPFLDGVPTLRLEEVRLVQAVENTRVRERSSSGPTVHYREPDPPVVAGDNTAALFGLDAVDRSLPPGPVTVEVTREFAARRPVTDSFELTPTEVDDLDWYSRVHTAAEKLQSMTTDGSTANDLPVFAPGPDLTAVRVTIGAGSGVIGDSERLVAGPAGDFTVEQCRPLRVGFVELRDGAFGKNYGTKPGSGTQSGRVGKYRKSVDVAVEYMQHVFPGDLLAYRFDVPFYGETKSGKKHLTADHENANRFAENTVNIPLLFPSRGQFLSTPNGAQQAERTLKGSGFDVVVLVVPSDYYRFHNRPKVAGLAPWSSTSAVSSIGVGGLYGTRMSVARTVAQEAGHHIVAQPYPDPKPADPLGQRRGKQGAETTHNGEHVDYDHARDESSDHDEDGTRDDPGVVSNGYSLADGEFGLVTGTGFDSSDQFLTGGRFGPEPLPSFMSYDGGDDFWTDARIHRHLVAYLSAGDTSDRETASDNDDTDGPTSVLGGTGRVEDGTFTVEDLTAAPGFPRPGDEEGSVRVELRDPAGERLVAERVADAGEVTHLGHVEGVFSFQLPFPTAAVDLHVASDGAESLRRNPVVGSVRDALARVPEGGFTDESVRARFASGLDRVERLMDESAFGEAADALATEVGGPLSGVETTYEPGLNRPPKPVLQGLVDRMTGRLRSLAEREG